MVTKSTTKRTCLEPREFFERFPARKKTLSKTMLGKHVSRVLIEQANTTTRKMTYFLMSAKAYGNACNEVSDLRNALSERERSRDAQHQAAMSQLLKKNSQLNDELNSLRKLERIRDTLEARDADLTREKEAATHALRSFQRGLEGLRQAIQKTNVRINGNLEQILNMPPDRISREASSFFAGLQQRKAAGGPRGFLPPSQHQSSPDEEA